MDENYSNALDNINDDYQPNNALNDKEIENLMNKLLDERQRK